MATIPFPLQRETSDLLRTRGMMVSLDLTRGHRVHGEIGAPFPKGLKDGTFTVWLFGVGKQVRFGRGDVLRGHVYRDCSTAGKRHDAVSFAQATSENKAYLRSRSPNQ